jgi:alginate O-acetyltransferase complex protein AlgI
MGLTFGVVLVGWVFFRAADLPRAWRYLGDLLGLHAVPESASLLGGALMRPSLLGALGVAALVVWGGRQTWEWTQRLTLAKAAVCLGVGALALVVLATQEYNPFIYFIF